MSSAPPLSPLPGPVPEPVADQFRRRALERLGTVVAERWRLTDLLGVGGMAAVYAATHRNGNRVAVKVLHAQFATQLDARERFLEEGYTANNVGHPGVVAVLDDGVTADGAAFLVMDLLEGETLDAKLQRSGMCLTTREALLVADALLDVLAAAHDKGIVHRDIKPENVFLTSDGQIKLLDFGIARAPEPRRTLRTQIGFALGTPAFMPPEQARGRWEEIDGRTDLWALGATLFLALTGEMVHDGATINEELLHAMTQAAPPLSSVLPDVPPAVASVVDRALAFDKEQRWPDARAMQDAVRAALAESGDAPAAVHDAPRPARRAFTGVGYPQSYRPVTTTEAPRPMAQGGRARWLGAGLAVIALGALFLVLGRTANGGSPPVEPAAPGQGDELRAARSEAAVEVAPPVPAASAEVAAPEKGAELGPGELGAAPRATEADDATARAADAGAANGTADAGAAGAPTRAGDRSAAPRSPRPRSAPARDSASGRPPRAPASVSSSHGHAASETAPSADPLSRRK